ncbi:2-phosphosulfolactate phosphatase [Pelagibius sp. Alg239-R121]|uniref:2-phosphosulfolactate phosphatase n=1 Tax=Pelagibius sp. Alg239-R121 TaxID=2993448 RepID=UPI0024A6B062|nr:2-phosphosulfolactate phosphatase [Pelagibius sp. Alg239-R121]
MTKSAASLSFAWGLNGLRALLPDVDVVVIVDVLSFSTAVDVAVSRGAVVLPYAYGREGAARYAAEQAAILAQPRSTLGKQISLSPKSLAESSPGQRIVLPSPNGSMLSEQTGGCPTFAGCLRNAKTVAETVSGQGGRTAVIAAGEKWPDGSLRPALEDLLGAGAILDGLCGGLTPEAETTLAAYRAMKDNCAEAIRACESGLELIQAGFADDVTFALAENESRAVPCLIEGAYRNLAEHN